MPYNTSTPEGLANARRQRRAWYYRNRQHVIDNNEKYRKKNKKVIRDWLIQFKHTLKCSICPENHPACLEFHHINPEEKTMSIARCVQNGWSIQRTKIEIDKCQIFCSNCHQKHHWGKIYE